MEWISSRRRLRRASAASLATPVFSSPICLGPVLDEHPRPADWGRPGEFWPTDDSQSGGPTQQWETREPDTEPIDIAEVLDYPHTRESPTQHWTGSNPTKPHGAPFLRPSRPSEHQLRLQSIVAFVARQEPRLVWAAGERTDNTTVIVTDIAHGWIPPRVVLPADITILAPKARGCDMRDLLGPVTTAAYYRPGDLLPPVDDDRIAVSISPRNLPVHTQLDWLLTKAAERRFTIPDIVQSAARMRAAAIYDPPTRLGALASHIAGTHEKILTDYPLTENASLADYMLIAAVESATAADRLNANYHYSWFTELATATAAAAHPESRDAPDAVQAFADAADAAAARMLDLFRGPDYKG